MLLKYKYLHKRLGVGSLMLAEVSDALPFVFHSVITTPVTAYVTIFSGHFITELQCSSLMNQRVCLHFTDRYVEKGKLIVLLLFALLNVIWHRVCHSVDMY